MYTLFKDTRDIRIVINSNDLEWGDTIYHNGEEFWLNKYDKNGYISALKYVREHLKLNIGETVQTLIRIVTNVYLENDD